MYADTVAEGNLVSRLTLHESLLRVVVSVNV